MRAHDEVRETSRLFFSRSREVTHERDNLTSVHRWLDLLVVQ